MLSQYIDYQCFCIYVSNTNNHESQAIKISFFLHLNKWKKIRCKNTRSFFLVLLLFLGIKSKINCLQLEDFSGKCEQRFRYFFETRVNFFSFNKALIKLHIIGNTATAFDPRYIFKSGKKTPEVGCF
jgi:hypothetical protein